jgi:hypothetical protein
MLHHVDEFEDGHEDVKLIGVYTSEELAQAALERVRNQPGFQERPDGFVISEVRLDKDSWLEGYITIRPLLINAPDVEFALCLDNSLYPASLELHKIYRVLPNAGEGIDGDIRVIDERGEDYLYPATLFEYIKVSQTVEQSILRTSGTGRKTPDKLE